MNIQFFGAAQFLLVLLLCYVSFMVSKKSKKAAVVIICVIPFMFLFTPVTFKQESFSKIESYKESVVEQELPDRITVEKEDYSVRDIKQSNQLKSESKELLNEILN